MLCGRGEGEFPGPLVAAPLARARYYNVRPLRPDDYATTRPPAPTKLRFKFNKLGNVVRNVHDCARAVRLIDQAYECAADF